MADLDKFRGTYPYASELSGVYQPILGWKSRLKLGRVAKESLAAIDSLVSGLASDSRVAGLVAKTPQPVLPTTPLRARPPSFLKSDAIQAVSEREATLRTRLDRPATVSELRSLVDVPELSSKVRELSERAVTAEHAAARLEGTQPRTKRAEPAVVHEAVVAGVIQHLSESAPEAWANLVRGNDPRWKLQIPLSDPLSQFDARGQRAFLSPIGLIHLYRQYFFELDTFLGPAVGHVWVSPGGTLDVYEVHTRRSLEERTIEQSEQVTTSTERTSALQDELSTAVARTNDQNLSVGVAASANVNFGVFEASASATFDYANAQSVAQQEAHKQTRSQTEKVASEVRKNFKTTFKSQVSDENLSSRRYVLQNTTDKLVNYELRRKMRTIAVQLQHIGTQLCWEVFIDDPGRELGIAELVHVAKPEDPSSMQPPTAPQPLLPLEASLQVSFPFRGKGDNDDRGENYVNGRAADDDDDDAPRIDHDIVVNAAPPAAGYRLGGVAVVNYTGPDASQSPSAAASFKIHESGVSFTMTLDQVNFDDQASLIFSLQLLWTPPDPNPPLEAYQKQLADYSAAQRRVAHAQYVEEVRARVEAAGRVQPRPSDDLRAEERVVVFRQLIQQLMRPAEHQPIHVATELVRGMFDTDKMLYFVAPDWWVPRERHTQSAKAAPPVRGRRVSASESLASSDLVTWGGAGDAERANYLITEESAPAPAGASLGWQIQLDADARRNAFLNAPWVKAVIPIRAGRELAALEWLTKAHVEGADGLDAKLAPEEAIDGATTIREAIVKLATQVRASHTMDNTLASETVFEKGFSPLEGGFKAGEMAVFDQWVEIMPTDQIVAMDYDPKS